MDKLCQVLCQELCQVLCQVLCQELCQELCQALCQELCQELCHGLYQGVMRNPYGAWCEFVWTFGLVEALLVLLLEKLLCDKMVEMLVLQNTWADLTCGLSISSALMLLSATIIFIVVFVCASCVTNIFCTIFSITAFSLYTADAVMAKLQCPSGYLSGGRGLLRCCQALVACVLLAVVTDFSLFVEHNYIQGVAWCIVVYVVCFVGTVVIILIHLIKLLGGLLCCALDRMEVIFNITALLLYLSAAIVWSIRLYMYYTNEHFVRYDWMWDHQLHDLQAATALTYINFFIYLADLIWSVVLLYNRI
ncbi:myeloid-associated differentiation marker-like protein 2 [Brachyhypopomus gauderio]|uniref:myeloid-associated differentiation marker-like protein 2 n=1 Tax=Brachyhypopomus gauderio TaxID=698409 RepID=UPI00404292FD